jgi:hypothetical protein
MRGASPGGGSDGAALPTDNTDWGESFDDFSYQSLMSQDQPIQKVPSSHVEVLEPPPLHGPWQLAPKSLRSGLVQVMGNRCGLLSTTVRKCPARSSNITYPQVLPSNIWPDVQAVSGI